MCREKELLMNEVQAALSKLIHLAHEEQDMVAKQDRKRMLEIDLDIEHTVGEKERLMGALKHHIDQHGC